MTAFKSLSSVQTEENCSENTGQRAAPRVFHGKSISVGLGGAWKLERTLYVILLVPHPTKIIISCNPSANLSSKSRKNIIPPNADSDFFQLPPCMQTSERDLPEIFKQTKMLGASKSNLEKLFFFFANGILISRWSFHPS